MLHNPAREHPAETRPLNNLLRVLKDEDYGLLEPHFQLLHRNSDHVMYNPGDNVDNVYFPCGPALASFLVANEDGEDTETILIGREGAVGGIVSAGRLPAFSRIIVKFEGPFVGLKLTELEAAKQKSRAVRQLFARYADCLVAQMLQSITCNAIHSVDQRAAKWIIATMERTGDHTVPLTHEQLARMLGVGRSYTSRVMQTFKAEGILETQRGSLLVRDHSALHARSCKCNDAVKHHFDAVLKDVYPEPDQDVH
ncbi:MULTISPECIES: Crp/Fnr family transcriptional regulator [Hyphomicrobiales]|uniref:cAMP-binding domain of CRP or a regulatory subunit of cAMP-dependent protein kinases n=2 Tax=Hyphomicrobiales TaxID=356 RepID=A0A1G5P3V2_AFIMA|nr:MULTISPECIES: Crp/Fnr family transcriptional regulator [Hyphomicrobiales]MBK1625089.1 Crp/Fnr family transcriptional regulator [Afifella marina DSM 2698]MBK1628793.1 Crp/Fnr family transcriptional regulator [Afifella marina]MBK5918451.1 Crp/Fnr family transcriptional regulator [Afifella marina]MDQ0326033.1 hypothetical protein [Rhodopseudomonas julia]RAI19493.1 Crp/Fnr family transcriptional regulator [Afifella marina DSM 2698]